MSKNQDLTKIAEFLDTKYRLPFGLRIGWDGILGFIPGIGDAITNTLSIYIIVRAAMLGAAPAVILRMGLNVFLDNLFDLVPILGNFFDIFWKSNTKNLALLNRFQADPTKTVRASKFAVVVAVLFVITVLIGSVIMVGLAAIWVWNQLMSMGRPDWSV